MDPAERFEAMSRLSRQMVVAARQNDWDALCRLESELAALRDQPAPDPQALARLPQAERERLVALITSMQADDAAVREVVEPFLDSVRGLLSSRSRSRDLRRSYGAFSQPG